MAAGTGERELQERAGLAVAEVAASIRRTPGRVEALVGKGNNGRDAVVAARDLVQRGWQAHCWLAPGHAVAEHELETLRSMGISWSLLEAHAPTPALEAALHGADVVLDGLLGVGAYGPMREPDRKSTRLNSSH